MKKMISNGDHAELQFAPLHISGRGWLLILLFITLVFSGCKKDHAEPRNICPPYSNCDTYITVRSVMCGAGVWGNYWFQLDNGDYLQPWRVATEMPKYLKNGERYKIGFKLITPDDTFDGVACLAVPPPARAIEVTCMEPVGCNTYVTVEGNSCFPAFWGEFWLVTDQGEYLQPWEGMKPNVPLADGMRLKIGYELSAASKPYEDHCNYFQAPPVAKNIKVTCVEAAPATTNCTQYATAQDITCGVGAWQNLWLRLDNGDLIQPWVSDVTGIQLQAGRRYKIGYQLMARDNRYDGITICMALPPFAEAARITCLEEQPLTAPK